MYKIVVIEDEVYLRKGLVVTTNWETYGCQVVAEFDLPQDALPQLEKIQPDIIITDIRMPGMTGLEMIELLKEELDCVYIIISGYDDFQYAKQSIELGVVGYLLKPIEDDELERILTRAVDQVRRNAVYKLMMTEKEHYSGDGIRHVFYDFEEQVLNIKDMYLEKALLAIRENYTQEIGVRLLAEKLSISESYLFKLFKKKTGYTILEWITYFRIKEALKLMRQTDMKVYEVAVTVGYKDVRHFSQVFKKYLGTTPTEFRNT
ncbi:MAG: response regulator transcription factor [Lachnospiraceae bacterium]